MIGREERRALATRLAAGLVLGYACVAVAQAIGAAIAIPMPAAGVGMRVAHLVTAMAETLGVGTFLVALPIFAWLWFVDASITLGFCVLGAAGALLLVPVAGVEVYRQACSTFDDPRLESVFYVVYLTGFGLVFPVAISVGLFCSERRRLFYAPLVLCLAAFVVDQLALGAVWVRDDYVSVHGVVMAAIGILLGATLSARAGRLHERLRATLGGKRLLAGLALFGAAGVLFPPPDRLRCELFRDPCTFAPWVLALAWPAPRPAATARAPVSSWYARRAGQPDVPPTDPPLLGAKHPLVVLVTIDATRGEAVNDPDNDGLFPLLARLKETGTTFLHATSPGSQTAVSLSTLFSGKTFTMLRWAYSGTGSMRFHYPAADPSVRFPELLEKAGVRTAAISSVNFQGEAYGVVRGFKDHKVVPRGRSHALARQITDPALEVLKRAGESPLFLYFHLMEPHAPYDRGVRTGTEYDRYKSEISVADREIARVVRFVDQRHAERAVIIVAADHGEAFGEHQTTGHSKTLYQEMLHVPLVVRTPDGKARMIEQRVELADLGPTILDIFGVPTPGSFTGQSLVPLLEGKDVELERPIVAEGRLRRALIRQDGMKVIDDPRRKIIEAYDLLADPDELRNVFGLDPRGDEALAALRAFFGANEVSADDPSYSPPYKP